MKTLRSLGRAGLVWVVFVITQAIAGLIVPMKAIPGASSSGWWLLSTFIAALTLTVVALRSGWRGWRAAAAVALIPLAIHLANLVEGLVFLKNAPLEFAPLMLMAVIAYAMALPALLLVFGGGSRTLAPAAETSGFSAGGMLWRFLVCDFSYLILYYTAGMIIYSSFAFVRAFYQTQGGPPPAAQIMALQLLLRGPLFVGLCVLLSAMVRLPRAANALAVGIAFTLLSGVVPLIMPNPVFPDAVRWVHFGEVVSSNLVFGSIVGWLWRRPLLVARAEAATLPEPLPV